MGHIINSKRIKDKVSWYKTIMVNNVHADVLQEKERVGSLSRIREIVFGAQDGLLVPLGVISTVAGAFNNHFVIVAGLSEALAGAFSMATGAYLSSEAERQVHTAEINKERAGILKRPENEKKELVAILDKDGMKKQDAQKIAEIMGQNTKAFINMMVHLELGVDPHPARTPIGDALFVGGSYLISAGIPLFPYFFLTGKTAIAVSIALTLIALFGLGLLKAKMALLSYLKSGFQVLLIGSGAGIGGYFLGTLLPSLLGIK